MVLVVYRNSSNDSQCLLFLGVLLDSSTFVQVLLFNPLCIAGYFVASLAFMKSRIRYVLASAAATLWFNVGICSAEEDILIEMFGQDYVEYRKRTPVGIPGIP